MLLGIGILLVVILLGDREESESEGGGLDGVTMLRLISVFSPIINNNLLLFPETDDVISSKLACKDI